MKSTHDFVAERTVAQHCAELLRTGPAPAELLPMLQRAGERMARLLTPAFALLLGSDEVKIAVIPPEQIGEADLDLEVGPLAANSLMTSPASGLTVLASVDGQAVLRLVDRAFGGPGETSGPLPETFPLSADMLIQRLDQILVRGLAEGLGIPDLASLRRDSDLGQLMPFAKGTRLVSLRLEISEGRRTPWQVFVALPLDQLTLLPDSQDSASKGVRSAAPADPLSEPFADMPLPLTARLVDMRVPLSALASLAPGSVIPVAVARAVPLAIGETIVARGTIGSADDRVAVRLTQFP